MHLGWNIVDRLRQEHHDEYDLVIRARPDLYLPEPLNLTYIKSIIDQHLKTVVISNGGQHGYQYTANDLIAISSPGNMAIYTDLVNHVKAYNDQQIVFHLPVPISYKKINLVLVDPPVPHHYIQGN
jgi:hypothetical protein